MSKSVGLGKKKFKHGQKEKFQVYGDEMDHATKWDLSKSKKTKWTPDTSTNFNKGTSWIEIISTPTRLYSNGNDGDLTVTVTYDDGSTDDVTYEVEVDPAFRGGSKQAKEAAPKKAPPGRAKPSSKKQSAAKRKKR